MTAYETKSGPEKTYLQTDKDFYSPGDTLWFKTYLVDGISHQKSGKSRVAYVELLNGNDSIVARRKVFVEGASAAGDIAIDAFIPEGIYRLRAFTYYMINDGETPLFKKWVAVGGKKLVTVRFRPGGNNKKSGFLFQGPLKTHPILVGCPDAYKGLAPICLERPHREENQ